VRKPNIPRQYEPLVTPADWKNDARGFAIRLSELLDLLFERQGRLERRLHALEKAQKGEKNDE